MSLRTTSTGMPQTFFVVREAFDKERWGKRVFLHNLSSALSMTTFLLGVDLVVTLALHNLEKGVNVNGVVRKHGCHRLIDFTFLEHVAAPLISYRGANRRV